MDLVGCHIEQTTKASHLASVVEQEATKDLAEEYDNVFTNIGELKVMIARLVESRTDLLQNEEPDQPTIRDILWQSLLQ